MTEKTGFLGLGTAGGLAAAAAVVAALAGVLYATGLLAPPEEPVTEAVIETPVEVTETAAEPESEAPAATGEAEPEIPAETAKAVPEAPAEETAESAETEAGEQSADEESASAETSEAESTVVEETGSQPQLIAPQFDVVRASPDGTTVIAGQAAPGSTVQVLVDGEVADSQTADGQGEFVSLLTLPSSTQARVVTLLSKQGDQESPSDADIILAPTPAPQVAEVEPEPAEDTVASVQAEAVETASEPETERASVESSEEPAVPIAQAEAETTETATAIAETETTETEPTVAEAVEETEAPSDTTEPVAVAVLRADSEGVELVQPATPRADLAPDQIALDTIGYSPQGDVLLSGRAPADALIRIYLNNVANADIAADGDGGWRARLGDIDPGVYTLRLDALDGDGAVISRLETPFKRESAEALASAQSEIEAPAEPAPISQVTVQAGDTLWAISRERYGDGFLYVRVFEANRGSIRDPDLIYPGQVFTIPD